MKKTPSQLSALQSMLEESGVVVTSFNGYIIECDGTKISFDSTKDSWTFAFDGVVTNYTTKQLGNNFKSIVEKLKA